MKLEIQISIKVFNCTKKLKELTKKKYYLNRKRENNWNSNEIKNGQFVINNVHSYISVAIE